MPSMTTTVSTGIPPRAVTGTGVIASAIIANIVSNRLAATIATDNMKWIRSNATLRNFRVIVSALLSHGALRQPDDDIKVARLVICDCDVTAMHFEDLPVDRQFMARAVRTAIVGTPLKQISFGVCRGRLAGVTADSGWAFGSSSISTVQLRLAWSSASAPR